MSDEDRKFLETAMAEAFSQVEDPNKIMAEAIKQIKADDRTDEGITTALEIIDRCCDDPDCARNAEKLDGVQPLLDLLSTRTGELRARTLEILALFFANNPSLQAVGIKRGALPIFVKLVSTLPVQSDERTKSLRALVALVRQVTEYEDLLLRKEGGVQLLRGCLDPAADSKMREKAASFAGALATSARLQAGETRLLAQAVAELLQNLAGETIQYRETLASSAFSLAGAFPAECAPELFPAVRSRLAKLQSDQDAEAEVEASTLGDFVSTFAAHEGAATAP